MFLNPANDALQDAGRNPPLEGCLTALFSDPPGGVAADEATGDCGGCEQPWISIMRDQPQKQQVGSARNRQGNDGGIQHRDEKKTEHAKMHGPAGQELVVVHGREGGH